MSRLLRTALALSLIAQLVLAQHTIDLSSLKWHLTNSYGNVSIAASFPSQSHLDLYAAGVTADPLYGMGDFDQLWVQRANWTYSTILSGLLTEEERQSNIYSSTWLVFDGLDTFTHIELCGQEVANTNNQFRQFVFDVSSIILQCRSQLTLSLNFGSASKIVLDIAKTGDANLNVTNSVGKEFTGKIYMRKEQSDFGWDWSPAFGPAGPWKPARVIQLSESEPVYVSNALIDIYREGQLNNIPPDQTKPFVFNASIDFFGDLSSDVSLHLELKDSSNQTVVEALLEGVYHNNETITGHTTIDSGLINLWWPAGVGDQPLYYSTITLRGQYGQVIATVERRVGFRTIVLNLTPISDEQLTQGIAPGSNWHFEINGHEIYAKGSNLVPPDVFWARVNDTKIRQLFSSVVMANQNMLRVWSSGAYLPDFAYDIADEMGLLLWSEFEFSDAEYPTNPDYLANYEAEAYYNIRRVSHHPSLALWAGGNELEAVELAYFFNATDPGTVFKQYQLVFEEILIKCVYANVKSISYIPSSTYNGYLSLDFNSVRPQLPRYNNRSSPDALYTDTDAYSDDAATAFDMNSYPVGRFADEFGIISMPSLESWQEVIPESQLSFDSEQVLHRNRHYPFGASGSDDDLSRAGIAVMTDGVKLWYPEPYKSDPIANFSAWAWSTQVYQADYYAHQLAFYRRGSGMRERQLGSLYWQLEDLWVAPTWASIEANGRHKAMYYSAKDIYEPVIIFPYLNDTSQTLEVWVTSDLWDPISGIAQFSWVDWAGNPLPLPYDDSSSDTTASASSFKTTFKAGPINATRVLTYRDISTLFITQQNTRNTTSTSNSMISIENALLRLQVTASPSGIYNSGQQPWPAPSQKSQYSHTYWFHPTSLANSTLHDPGLKLTHAWNKDGSGGSSKNGNSEFIKSVTFSVTAQKAVAAWVWLDYSSSQVQGLFDYNGFWLNKGESKDVTFMVYNDWTGDGSWVDSVTVRSLYDNLGE